MKILQIIKGEKDRVNLYARIGPDNLDGIMFSGHTDVVPVEGQNWNSNPFSLKKVGTTPFSAENRLIQEHT